MWGLNMYAHKYTGHQKKLLFSLELDEFTKIHCIKIDSLWTQILKSNITPRSSILIKDIKKEKSLHYTFSLQ